MKPTYEQLANALRVAAAMLAVEADAWRGRWDMRRNREYDKERCDRIAAALETAANSFRNQAIASFSLWSGNDTDLGG